MVFEKQKKSLSQAKCLTSLTVLPIDLDFYVSRNQLLVTRPKIMPEPIIQYTVHCVPGNEHDVSKIILGPAAILFMESQMLITGKKVSSKELQRDVFESVSYV